MTTTSAATTRIDGKYPSRRGDRRGGFTLIEILLVLVLIAVLAALVVPITRRSAGTYRLGSGGTQLRALLTRARTAAIREGRPYAFYYEQGGSRCLMRPCDAASANQTGLSGSLGTDTGGFSTQTKTFSLPKEVVFHDVQVAGLSDSGFLRSTDIDIDRDTGSSAYETDTDQEPVTWAGPVMFYPDGTTSDARFVVRVGSMGRMVSLRGLTGTTSLGQAEAIEEGTGYESFR